MDAGRRFLTAGPRKLWRFSAERPEPILLGLALAWTALAKASVLRDEVTVDQRWGLVEALASDLVFYAAAALTIELVRWLWPGRWAARATLVAATALAAWGFVNGAWLVSTSVQLQPGVVALLARNTADFWPLVRDELGERPALVAAVTAGAAAAAGWILWRVLRPPATRPRRRRVAVAATLLGVATLIQVATRERRHAPDAVSFSSPWYALVQAVEAALRDDDAGPAREIPRAGERQIVARALPDPPPSVVVVFLESVNRQVTSLDPRPGAATPELAALAAEGVELALARAPVPQTNKALYLSLTGTMPDLRPDYVEGVLVDEPYESLATVLGRHGYESAFFQMSRGEFAGMPGLMANLGFDHAFMRENLEDPSAHLSFLNGDDFRMIEPMMRWVDARDGPFFLAMITSVSHRPFVVPSWFDEPAPVEDRRARYLQSVVYTDAFLSRLRDELEDRGLFDEVLLCVIGDHGEGFRATDRRVRWAPHEEILRVPWVLRFPGRLPAGARVERPVSQLDLAPTLLALLGFDLAGAGFEGHDALGPVPADRRIRFTAWFRNSPLGWVEGARKRVYWPYTDTLYEYDLDADPEERRPRVVDGEEKRRTIEDLRRWEASSRVEVHRRRFRERLLFDRWLTYSSGRSTKSFYVPPQDS